MRQRKQLNELYSRVSRRIVPLLLLGYIIAYLDRVNVGFAKLEMLEDLGFSETTYGLGAGVFFIGYFLFEVPSNLILHRVGARVWISRIMISWGLISAAMMFVTTPAAFYALRFFLGAAEAGFFPGIIYYLTLWLPAHRRATVTATFMTGIAISSMFGSLLSGWILQRFDGMNGWAGWQWLFLLEALPAMLLGIYIFFRLDNSAREAQWLTVQEKVLLEAELAAGAKGQSGHTSTSFTEVLRDRRVWFACVIYFCSITGLYGVGFWLPTIIADMGVKRPLEIGMLTAIPYAVAAIAMVLVGRSADKRNERRWHVAIPAALGALGLFLSVQLSSNAVLAMGALTLAIAGILTVPPLFWSIPAAHLSGAGAAAGIAIINSFGNLAGFVSPYMVGAIKDLTKSIDAGLSIIAVLVLTCAILVLAYSRLTHEKALS